MIEIAKLGALVLVACIFVYGLNRNWDGVYLVFGIIFMLGSCSMLGVH